MSLFEAAGVVVAAACGDMLLLLLCKFSRSMIA
jgi:hypothetical protein